MSEPSSLGVEEKMLPRLAAWVLLLALFTTVLTIAFAHAPARLRLIGLFSIAFGVIVGLAALWLADVIGMRRRSLIPIGAFAAIVLGQIGVVSESYRLSVAERRAQAQQPGAEEAIAAAMLEQGKAPDNPHSRKLFEEMRVTLAARNTFSAYLARRLSSLGSLNSPLPELFWGLEVLLAAAVGTFVAYRRAIAVEPVNPI